MLGVFPKYWEFVEAGQNVVTLAEALYFDSLHTWNRSRSGFCVMREYPGSMPWLYLRPWAGVQNDRQKWRSGWSTAQTNLSRLLQHLLDTAILVRELPFGESVRSTKKILYRIHDPTMRFWFRVYSPHQSLWRTYTVLQTEKPFHDHAATVFECVCRARFPGAQRYWERDVELDLVAPDPRGRKTLLVVKVKWRRLSVAERKRVLRQLEGEWAGCLRSRYPRVRFEVLDAPKVPLPAGRGLG